MRVMLLATNDRELSEPFEDKDAKLVTLEVFDNNENNLSLDLSSQVSSDFTESHHYLDTKPVPNMSTNTYYPMAPACARNEVNYYPLGTSAMSNVVPSVPTSVSADLSDFHDVSIDTFAVPLYHFFDIMLKCFINNLCLIRRICYL